MGSLELALDNTGTIGECESGYSCAYTNTLSWRTPTTPMPMENQPRAVFETLFGDSESTDSKSRLAQIESDHSVLDFVSDGVSKLMKNLGAGDRSKLSEYFDAIRDVERRIVLAEEQSSRSLPLLNRPTGLPATDDEQAQSKSARQGLACQRDMTRRSAFLRGHVT